MTGINLVTILLTDEDINIPKSEMGALAIIAKFEDVVVPAGEREEMTLLKLAVNEDIKGMLTKHNEKRAKVNNQKTLERHAKEVPLSPITIEDVTIKMK